MSPSFARLAAAAALGVRGVVGQDLFSDIISAPEGIQREALSIKHERFWGQLLSSVEGSAVPETLRLCNEAGAVIEGLPPANSHVGSVLRASIDSLCRANEAAFAQIVSTSKLAQEKLGEGPWKSASIRGAFMRGGSIGSIFQQLVRQFVTDGSYAEQLQEQVGARQADLVPLLQGMVPAFGDRLKDCRSAQSLAFDVLKYDLYNRGVPKTPESAKEFANRIIDAAGKTRRQFTSIVTSSALAMAGDATGQKDSASVTVLMSSLSEQASAQQQQQQQQSAHSSSYSEPTAMPVPLVNV